MKKLFRYCFICLIVVSPLTLFSQEALPNIIPPSVEAAALARFTEVPVGHYTGIPNVSIPIHTIEANGIKIPISLRYHSRGVQVSEVAPRTGTGWSLSYGGSISRQIRGKADDTGYPNGYLKNTSIFQTYSTLKSTRDTERNLSLSDPAFDYYPDLFSFGAGDIDGKFILSYVDQQPVVQSFGDVKIEYLTEDGKIASFTIKDSNGNTFYYGQSKDGERFARDSQTSVGKSVYFNRVVDHPVGSGESGEPNIYSTWHLLDIETATGDLISYFYQSEWFIRSGKAYDKHDSEGNTVNSADNFQNIQNIHSRLSIINIHEYKLSEIRYGKGKIVFTDQPMLRDDYNGYALDQITINDQNDFKIKEYKLNYSYTTSTDKSNLLWYFNTPTFLNSFKRLFLESIEEEGKNEQKLPPYIFTYDSTVLPSRFSTQQDYWGYYNGAQANGPFLRMFDYGNYRPDRRVSTLNSQAGLLLKIQYPTGGTTNFIYEDNIGSPPSFLSEVQIPSVNPISDTQEQIVLTKSDFTYNAGGYEAVSLTFPCAIVSYNIFCFHVRHSDDDPNIPDCIFNFVMDNGIMQVGSSVNFSTCSDNTKIFRIIPKVVSGVDPSLHLSSQYDFRIYLTYNNNNEFRYLYAGGKRIKKIEYESFNGTILVKEFEYNRHNTSVTSGAIVGLPSFLERKESNSNIYLHYYDSDSSFGTFQPNAIGYSNVTEYHGTKEDNLGKTEYTFTNLSDSGGDYYRFPYHPPTDNEWLRGRNIRTKIFSKNQENVYVPIKETYFKYKYHNETFAGDFDFAGLSHPDFKFTPLGSTHDYVDNFLALDNVYSRTLQRLQMFMPRRFTEDEFLNGLAGGYRLYHFTGGTVNLEYSVETDYFDNAPDMVKTTNYSYAYDRHYQLSKTETIDSKGKVVSNTNYYPIDITEGAIPYPIDESAALDTLISQNRLEVVRSETKRDGTLLSTVNNLYHNDSFALPKLVQTSKGTGILEDRIIYHSYYPDGNVKEVSRADGIKTTYIWGYNGQYPIAKIEGASFGDIPSGVYSSIVSASNSDVDGIGEDALRGELAKLRSTDDCPGLTGALVTTYTYDPLVGMTSMTDAGGHTVYYEYDVFNRLEQVRDAVGNILNRNEYHYRVPD